MVPELLDLSWRSWTCPGVAASKAAPLKRSSSFQKEEVKRVFPKDSHWFCNGNEFRLRILIVFVTKTCFSQGFCMFFSVFHCFSFVFHCFSLVFIVFHWFFIVFHWFSLVFHRLSLVFDGFWLVFQWIWIFFLLIHFFCNSFVGLRGLIRSL